MEKIKEFLKKPIYKKFKVWHLLIILIIIGANRDCLVGYDWMTSSGASAWKFSDDGTFSFSTTAFGGMSSRGNWSLNNGSINISYTWNSDGMSLPNQTLSFPDCNTLLVGSTTYIKN